MRCAPLMSLTLISSVASSAALAPASGATLQGDALSGPQAERWAQQQVESRVRSGDVTAAAVAVVSGGKVLCVRSYGWFDPVQRIPIRPDDQFMVGSITKSFVGLVIARLQEQGRIRSLDDAANLYLKRVRLPRNFGRDVSIRELAAHTAGLESPAFGLSTGRQPGVPASGDYLRQQLPQFVRPPGFKSVYANFGPPILGALAEDVTGERFDRVMATQILDPLGLHATALSYDPSGGPRLVYAGITGQGKIHYAPRTINDPMIAPAGSIQTTPGDMARYLNALLGHAPEVLSPKVLAVERTPIAVNYPGLSPVALGVFLDRWNDTTLVGHGGLIAGFRSNMVVVPSRDFGVFVVFAGGHDAFNGGPGDPGAVTDALLKEVLGPAVALPARPVSDPRTFVGRYWGELRAHTTPEALLGADRLLDVTVAPGGGLLIGPANGAKERFVEVAPGLFQGPAKDGRRPTLYGFEPGRLLANKMYSSKVEGLHDPRVLVLVALALLGLALTGLVRIVGKGKERWMAAICGVAALAFACELIWPVITGVVIELELFRGDDLRFRVASAASWVLLLAGIATAIVGVRALPRAGASAWRVAGAAHLAVVGLAGIGFAAVAWMFHLL